MSIDVVSDILADACWSGDNEVSLHAVPYHSCRSFLTSWPFGGSRRRSGMVIWRRYGYHVMVYISVVELAVRSWRNVGKP